MLLKSLEVLVREEDEAHFIDLGTPGELFPRCRERNAGCPLDRVAVDTGRDRWEGHSSASELFGDLERAAVARGQKFRLALISAAPDGPNRVDDVAGG